MQNWKIGKPGEKYGNFEVQIFGSFERENLHLIAEEMQ